MRTTLRKREFAPSNASYPSRTPFKRRKLNSTVHQTDNNAQLSFDESQLQSMYQQLISIKNKHKLNESNNRNTTSNREQNKKIQSEHKPKFNKKQNCSATIHHEDINTFLEIDEQQNHDINNTESITQHVDDDHEDWNNFINSVDFKSEQKHSIKPSPIKSEISTKIRDKSSLISTATATDGDWKDFLEARYDANDQRNKDWKPPEIHTFWDQGPIGMMSGWWNDDHLRTRVDQKQDDTIAINDTKHNKKELTASEISQKKRNKLIKLDIMKELKQQRLEKRLRDRMECGEIVKNMDDANNPFESFFTSALEMGDRIRSGDVIETLKNEEEKKKEKKTKIFEPKLKKIKTIATFDGDDLFYIESSDEDEDRKNDINKINANDMIYLNENSIGNSGIANTAIVAGKIHSEQILLRQRVEMQHKDILCNGDEGITDERNKMKDGMVSAKILSDTVEDSLKEKKILKKLNVMDFVTNYKNAFFREVKELKLNRTALVDNWKIIRKHEGLSRKLRKKLGIMMAREKARRAKENKSIHDMINDSDSDDTVDTEMEHSVHVLSEIDTHVNNNDPDDICSFLNE